ncbi:MAG TPA: folylpolyglutamate synthase/dihydrofolate synthase family protein [Acidimicrobiales bacterium]|nr:folylpolyglutamate synthase/dihydrofolate synthase family protein [Acidimicrobiales bacterium]
MDRGDVEGGELLGDALTVAELPFDELDEALRWLDGHIDFESTMPSRRSLPTLDRMHAVMAALGDPHLSIPSIHVTGTNGKGSTSAMLTCLLMAQGLTVGTYTSPNLHRVSERIARDGEPISNAALLTVLSQLAAVEPLLGERLTRFELLTAAALSWFGDEAVDAMVIEVGLGGTWDCTNVVHGDVALLTNVSYDHTDVLGPTLEGIAADKAGILEPGKPVVIGETHPDLVEVVLAAAAEVGAGPVWVTGQDFGCASNEVAVGGRLVTLWTPGSRYEDLLVPLHGAHQGANASGAVAAAEAFFGRPLDEDVVSAGLAAVRVPGRLEVLGRRPLFLVDGAHNVAGMTALGLSLAEEFAVDGEKVAVVGMLSGRDPSAMLAALAPAGIARVIACEPDSPRAIPARDVAEAGRALGMTVLVEPVVADAVALARGVVDTTGLIVVAGSLYVVGDARGVILSAAVPWEEAGG